MRQRARLFVASALPSVLFGVWSVFLTLTGTAAGAAAPLAPLVSMDAPTTPVASMSAHAAAVTDFGAGTVRLDDRRQVTQAQAPHAAVPQQIVVADATVRPPGPPPVLPGPVSPAPVRRVHADGTVQPRQERAPPRDPYDPRDTRAPPFTRHS
ncbi:hypothetical protein [Streptomyces sp. NPDC002889]|uniref:hypothetical protein n=1 Tax=Streptomyces sp. NPDC002889 TaxID=3364669 RepID=UPI00369A3FC2